MKKIAATLIAFAAMTHTATASDDYPNMSGSYEIFVTQMAEASVNVGLALGWEYSCGHITAAELDQGMSAWTAGIATKYYPPEMAQDVTGILMRGTDGGAQLALEYDCDPETGAAILTETRASVERLFLIGK